MCIQHKTKKVTGTLDYRYDHPSLEAKNTLCQFMKPLQDYAHCDWGNSTLNLHMLVSCTKCPCPSRLMGLSEERIHHNYGTTENSTSDTTNAQWEWVYFLCVMVFRPSTFSYSCHTYVPVSDQELQIAINIYILKMVWLYHLWYLKIYCKMFYTEILLVESNTKRKVKSYHHSPVVSVEEMEDLISLPNQNESFMWSWLIYTDFTVSRVNKAL